MTGWLDIAMVAALLVAILSGFPAAFSIAGVAILFAGAGIVVGAMDAGLLGAIPTRIFDIITNPVLVAIPLFVLMGAFLERSGLAADLLHHVGRAFGARPGGLAVSVILVGTLLAASTGIVGATIVALGMIVLPAMLAAGYDKRLASGLVCAAGSLGQIIPPSVLIIVLAEVMSNAHQQAQFTLGRFAPEALSVGQFFAAALIPGLVLSGLYLVWVVGLAILKPARMPPLASDLTTSPAQPLSLSLVFAPFFLILAVLGSLVAGVATPSEAASLGALGALILVALRVHPRPALIAWGGIALVGLLILAGGLPLRLQRDDLGMADYALAVVYISLGVLGLLAVLLAFQAAMRAGIVRAAAETTVTMTAMIFTMVIAASIFSLVFVGLGGGVRIQGWIEGMPGGAAGALLFCLGLVFVLGCFLDFVEIAIIVLPLIVPPLIVMGHDPIWLGILLAMVLQTSFLTPPFGLALFYLRGVAPSSIPTRAIFAGVVPFIGLQLVAVGLLYAVPALATWLPARL